MGAIVGVGVSAIVLVTLIAIVNKGGDGNREAADREAADRAPNPNVQDQQPAKPSVRDESTDASSPGEDNIPDRSAPVLRGKMIIAADALCKSARRLHADALRAKEAGDDDSYNELIKECRLKFKEIKIYFGLHTKWLEDAKRKNWTIPRTYDTLQRRMARYEKHEARLLPK